MATLKLTIFKAKALKDGRHKIRIAICHKHETAYIITRFIIDSESQFKNGQVVKRPDASIMNMKLRNLLNEYQDKLDNIKNISLYTCHQIKRLLEKDCSPENRESFMTVSNNFLSFLNESGRIGYAQIVESSCNDFISFCKGDILLEDITPEIIENYSTFLRVKRKLSEATIGMLLRNLKTIINRGVKKQLVSYPIHPFIEFKIPVSPVRESDISIESFIKIKNSEFKLKKLNVAKDLFLLSFYLGGINLIDLLSIEFHSDRIEYVRTKSQRTSNGNNTISLTIPDEAMEIINKWKSPKTQKLDFGYKFSYKNFSRYVTRSLQEIAKQLKIQEHLIYYSARKSFAQYASEIGIPDGIIDYCLGHSDKSKGIIRYYTKVRQKQADMAINKVIDYVKHPDKYKEYIELKQDIMLRG